MGSTYYFTAGRTKPIIHQLLAQEHGDTRAHPFDATGTSIALELTDQDGNTVVTTGDVAWDNAVESKAKYTPDAGDLVSGKTLTAHWKITDGLEIFHIPEGPGDTWEIA